MSDKTPPQQFVKKEILSIGITNASEREILEYVFGVLHTTQKKLSIVTPNPEIVMYAVSHKSYRDILNQADISLCDGVGLFEAGKFLGTPVKARISGLDFMESLCKESVREGVTVGFLGGRNDVAERVSDCLSQKYPGLAVAFIGEDWPQDYSQKKTIDILFVAYGFPKQEEWIAKHLHMLPVRVMMGVGGSFDVLSGDIARAPMVMRRFGLEWLYRLIRQPWRIKRQFALPKFLFLVIKEKLNK